MDILTPFLPRINYVEPIDKSTLYVVGVTENKLKKIKREKKQAVLSELEKKKESKDIQTEQEDGHIDTWA